MVYVFHVIIPSNQIWQKILSQTNIFNIFPASVPFNSVTKILQANCISRGKTYIPVRLLWLTRLFTELANSHEKHCLTIDCSYLNKNGPGRFRTQAENPEKQVCFFAKPNDDKFFNTLLSNRIKTAEYENKIYFQIERIRSADGSHTFSIKKTLENGTGRAGSSELRPNANEQSGSGTKRPSETAEYFFRRDRKSARPQFLDGR